MRFLWGTSTLLGALPNDLPQQSVKKKRLRLMRQSRLWAGTWRTGNLQFWQNAEHDMSGCCTPVWNEEILGYMRGVGGNVDQLTCFSQSSWPKLTSLNRNVYAWSIQINIYTSNLCIVPLLNFFVWSQTNIKQRKSESKLNRGCIQMLQSMRQSVTYP